jgi:long-chain acyl-CoA synthetase
MMKKISDAPSIVGSIFHLAVTGKQTLPWPLTEVIDKVLFRRVKMATGGRLRLAVCGGEDPVLGSYLTYIQVVHSVARLSCS